MALASGEAASAVLKSVLNARAYLLQKTNQNSQCTGGPVAVGLATPVSILGRHIVVLTAKSA